MKKSKEDKVKEKWSAKLVKVFTGGKWQKVWMRTRNPNSKRHQGPRECARRLKWKERGIYESKKHIQVD